MKIFVAVLLVALANAEIAPLMKMREKVDGQYIIKMKEGFKTSFFENHPLFASLGAKIFSKYSTVFEGFAAKLSDKALEFVRNSNVVEWVEEDGISHASVIWGLDRLDQRPNALDNSFSPTYKGSGVNVYILDTGINPNHNDFGGRASVAYDSIGSGIGYLGYGIDCHGHGTHCAGSVGGNTYGVATSAKLYGVRVLSCLGSGSNSAIAAGCDYVASSGKRPAVASMSLGGAASLASDNAVAGMVSSGVVTAVAAGNEDQDACNCSPARESSSICVGASTPADKKASFSNWGSCVDLFAPGTDIVSARHDNNFGSTTMSGTSMATPQVAGILAALVDEFPLKSTSGLKSQLLADATNESHATKTVVRNLKGSPEMLAYVY